MSVLRTIVSSSRALAHTAKDAARLREIAAVFIKHGFGWVVAQMRVRRDLQIGTGVQPEINRATLESPETGKRLVRVLTELGPTWVKFGQIMSTRSDLLPPAIIIELATLQDDVEPVPFEDIQSQLAANLGENYMEHFEELSEEPLASASIGQVHRAKLKDGSEVVLKIQRPGIEPNITSDLSILHVVAGYVEEAFDEAAAMDLQGMVRDFAKSLSHELDYRAEANNMERFRRNFEDNDRLVIPIVHEELSNREVICMEFLAGRRFDDVIKEAKGSADGMVELYFDIAYKMLFVDGFFHGDLHPGNVLVVEGDKLGLLDCGMVGRLAPRRKEKVIDIIYAVINEDLEGVARTFYALSIAEGNVDYPAFEADSIAVAEKYLVGVPLSQIQIGELFSELVAGATKHSVRMPTDFTMMFKAIITTEGLAKSIAPNVDPIELAKPFIHQMIAERYSPERMKQIAMTDFQVLSGLMRQMPHTLPMLMDNLQAGRLQFGVAEETLATQAKAAELRVGRTIRASFAITCFVCGTVVMGFHLPIALWGIPWLSLVFWGIAVFWSVTLLRRGGLM